MNRSLFLAALMSPAMWASATYTFTGSNYNQFGNFSTCSVGPCANFTTSMSPSGSFTIATALPANSIETDITSQLISYSFSDGLHTYTNGDPNVRIFAFEVGTDATGKIKDHFIYIELWQTGSSPHTAGNRFARIAITNINSSYASVVENDASCGVSVGTSTAGIADTCLNEGATQDSSYSFAQDLTGIWTSSSSTTPPPPTVPLPPTLILGVTGLLSVGLYQVRRKFVK